MTDFQPLTALLGGALIGLAAAAMLVLGGRITGISSIWAGLLRPARLDIGWQAAFVAGLLGGGLVLGRLRPDWFRYDIDRSMVAIAAAGLLVGFGTRLGNGCTSGHGVCGVSRLSTRSIVATVTFMLTGAITTLLVERVLRFS